MLILDSFYRQIVPNLQETDYLYQSEEKNVNMLNFILRKLLVFPKNVRIENLVND